MGRSTGKVALATGAGAGIGRATALRFASEGACVVVAEIDVDAGRRTEQQVRSDGGDALFVRTDVTDLPSVEAAVAATVDRYGQIDVLFNCAGGSLPDDGPVTEVDLDLWAPTMDVNVRGTIHGCRAAIPAMIRSGGGSIVNMTSVCALLGNHPLASLLRRQGGDHLAHPRPGRSVLVRWHPGQRHRAGHGPDRPGPGPGRGHDRGFRHQSGRHGDGLRRPSLRGRDSRGPGGHRACFWRPTSLG